MRRGGTELLVGVVRDPQWGPVLAVAIGGLFVEILNESVLAPLPVSAVQAGRLLDRLRGRAVLDGARGGVPADRGALAAVIARIGDLALALGEDLESLEVNPLLVDGARIEALDAAVTWREENEPGGPGPPYPRRGRGRAGLGAPRHAGLPGPLAGGPGRRRGPGGADRQRGGPGVVAAAIDTVAGVRQFENSFPRARAPLGRSDNYPRSVAGRIAAAPARAVLEVSGGQSPQHLVNEFARVIAAGDSEVTLIFGSEAISTAGHFAREQAGQAGPGRPDFTEHAEGSLEDRGFGLSGMMSRHQAAHGLTGAPSQYALIDNARRARLGQTREEYAAAMGALFAPFTAVAAANPHASAPVERGAAELVTPTEANRPIADPYTRYIVAREKVNQGAAVLLMSVAAARRLGVPEDRWVFLPGHADVRDRDLLDRADLSAGPASVLAVRHALDVAGISLDEVSAIDLYSCFPAPVFNICDGLGLAADDPRGLTLTGGLPFFGGAGNNYSMHAIAEAVQRARTAPGSYALVGANGGVMTKYSAGIYSTRPAAWVPDDSVGLQAEIDGWAVPEQAHVADGPAVIETYTVKHARDGRRTGIVIGRLRRDGRRFIARGDDPDLLDLLTTAKEPIGQPVYVRSSGAGNRVTTTRARMDELFPPEPAVLRERYEHVLVRRDGHLLEVTINRPESRNSLHPMANDELDHVFGAYFADDELWVAILTGAGDKAFSAGNDLVYSASGQAHVGAEERVRRPDRAPVDAQARHRRGQRLRHGRRLRDRAGLPPGRGRRNRPVRAQRGPGRAGRGRGRPGPAAAHRAAQARHRDDPHRPPPHRRRGPGLRPGQPGRPGRDLAGRRPRPGRGDPRGLAHLGPRLAADHGGDPRHRRRRRGRQLPEPGPRRPHGQRGRPRRRDRLRPEAQAPVAQPVDAGYRVLRAIALASSPAGRAPRGAARN